tara:strand:- start:596 stop:772 length:177 start_codon:yes stop_codon:yes gene_type:complete
MRASTPSELNVPVQRDVKLHPRQARVIIVFLLYLSAAIPHKIPQIEKDRENPAPDKSP